MSEGTAGFLQSLRLFFLQALDFKGKSSRSAYWWVIVWSLLGSGVLNIFTATKLVPPNYDLIGLVGNLQSGSVVGVLLTVIVLLLVIPSTALLVRRFHDAGRNAWVAYVMGMLNYVVNIVASKLIIQRSVLTIVFLAVYLLFGLYTLYVTLQPSRSRG